MTTHPAIVLSTTVARSNDLMSAEVDNEMVMLSLKQSEYFGFDAIGTHIWTLLEHPLTVAELCKQLVTSYAVDAITCQQETIDFLQELYAAEIITIVEASAA